MAGRTFCRRYQNWILTGLFLLLLLVFVGVRYDYYFDLNDDVLMKDILAGVYTGAPESRNIQMRWPISALISLLYRIAVWNLFVSVPLWKHCPYRTQEPSFL